MKNIVLESIKAVTVIEHMNIFTNNDYMEFQNAEPIVIDNVEYGPYIRRIDGYTKVIVCNDEEDKTLTVLAIIYEDGYDSHNFAKYKTLKNKVELNSLLDEADAIASYLKRQGRTLSLHSVETIAEIYKLYAV